MKLRDNPCETCGWKYPGFHVCIDPSAPVDNRIQRKHNSAHMQSISPEHRQRLAQGLSDRWQRHRDETAARDRRIVELYNEGETSIKGLATQFGIAFQTARNVLLRAEEVGETRIRPQGYNGKVNHVR